MERRNPIFTAFIYLCAILLAAVILAPLAWLFIMSISPASELFAKPLHWWPDAVDFSRYRQLLTVAENSAGAAFLAALRNSIEVAGMATIAVPLHVPIPESPAYTRWPDLAASTPAALAEVLAAHRAGAPR